MNATFATAAFWILATLTLLAVLFWVLPPLFRRPPAGTAPDRRDLNIAVYRDQYRELEEDHRNGLLSGAQRDAARLDLETRLARDALAPEALVNDATVKDELARNGVGAKTAPADPGSRRLGAVLAATVPVLALGVYLVVGEPGFVIQAAEAEQAEHDREQEIQEALARLEQQVDQALVSLEETVRTDPEDGLSWTFLANAYIARDRWVDAESAYARAYALLPDQAVVVSGYAEALAINAGRDLSGRPIELVREALALDAEDPKGLEMAGIHAYQSQEYGTAAYFWNQLLRQLPADTPAHAELNAMVRSARGRSRAEAFGEEAVAGPERATTLSGHVELAPELAAQADSDAIVYLFARTATGNSQPLAALRTTLDQLPVAFTLDDGLALSPDHVLSNHESITLVARVSRDGAAQAHSGDLEGTLEAVRVGSSDVRIVIDTVRP